MNIQTDASEIFDCLAPQAPELAGREEEVSWLTSQLCENARVVLSGPAGIGKSAIAHQALRQFSTMQETVGLRLDLDRYTDFAGVAQTVEQAVDFLSNNRATKGVIGDPFPLRESAQNSAGHRGEASPQDLKRFTEGLAQLSRIGAAQKLQTVFLLESSQRLSALGGDGATATFQRAMQEQFSLRFVCCSQQSFVEAARRSPIGQGVNLASRALDRVNPAQLARWINERFAQAGLSSDGVGEQCTQLGGPRTSDVIELAKATFDVAAMIGRATALTVRNVMQNLSRQDSPKSAEQWSALSPEEKNFVSSLVQKSRGEPVGIGSVIDRFSLGHLDESQTEYSLLKKGVLEKLPSGRLFVQSATFAHWTAEYGQLKRSVAFKSAESAVKFEFSATRSVSSQAKFLGF